MRNSWNESEKKFGIEKQKKLKLLGFDRCRIPWEMESELDEKPS